MTLPAEFKPRTTPYAHQIKAVELAFGKRGFAYLMEMGTGKTKSVIDEFCLSYEKNLVDGLLVIAPKGVYSNWTRKELPEHLWVGFEEHTITHLWQSHRYQKDKERIELLMNTSPGARILVMNIEAISSTQNAREVCKRFVKTHRTMIVVDESTTIKNQDAARTKQVVALGRLATMRRILTGSPSTGSPLDLYSQFDFLDHGCLGHRSYWTFRQRYCILRDMPLGGRTIKTVVGTQNLAELSSSMKRLSYRVRKEDCLDLPPKIYIRREVELTEEQTKIYMDLKRKAMTELTGGLTVSTQLVITQLLRMHQVVCGHVKTDDGTVVPLKSNRVDALMDVLEETDESVIVWANYIADLKLVARTLRAKYGDEQVVEFYGETPLAERDSGTARFQNKQARFMVTNQPTGARGNTWTAASLVVYYSNNHDLELRQQSEDRAHRIGQTKSVTYVDLVAPGTVDDSILRALREKRDIVSAILSDGVTQWM